MRNHYTLLLIMALVCLGTSLTPPFHRSVDTQLLQQPEMWDLQLNTPDGQVMGFDAKQSKAFLLRFLAAEGYHRYLPRSTWTASCIVAVAFALLGWRRERWLACPPGSATVLQPTRLERAVADAYGRLCAAGLLVVILSGPLILLQVRGMHLEEYLFYSDNWEVRFRTPDQNFAGHDAAVTQRLLRDYLRSESSRRYNAHSIEWWLAMCVATGFCFVGWRTEQR